MGQEAVGIGRPRLITMVMGCFGMEREMWVHTSFPFLRAGTPFVQEIMYVTHVIAPNVSTLHICSRAHHNKIKEICLKRDELIKSN